MAAVNRENVFRIFSKPCPTETLIRVLKDAVAQNGSYYGKSASFWTKPGERWTPWPNLSTAKPLFFGQRQEFRRVANELAAMMNAANSWRVDVAAVFPNWDIFPYLKPFPKATCSKEN